VADNNFTLVFELINFLSVKNFALIENVEVEFRQGFNTLTGETGAGKTVLVGAISQLLGDRAESIMVRSGTEEASFSCQFDLSGHKDIVDTLRSLSFLGEGENELTLTRQISVRGKSRCTINGRLCPVSTLSEVGSFLVDIHGQNEHQALLNPRTHIEYLDRYAGADHLKNLSEYRKRYNRFKSLISEQKKLLSNVDDFEREISLLAAEIEEIERADMRPGEIEELEQEASKYRNSRELFELGSQAKTSLSSGFSHIDATELLSSATANIRRMAEKDKALTPILERIESIQYELSDISLELKRYIDNLDIPPGRLEEIESRISLIRNILRKYGGTYESVCEYLNEAKQRLSSYRDSMERLGSISSEIEKEKLELLKLSQLLYEKRRDVANGLESAVTKHLEEMNLGDARFIVEIIHLSEKDENNFNDYGLDSVEFLFSSTSKQEAKPLRKVASGGEMSRAMLAIKIVLTDADRIPVLVFDEVDSGIGGEVARKVGEKLSKLSLHHQVLCVTHLPQIASFADWQFMVYKKKESSRTNVELVEGEARVDEICRMLGDSSGRRATKEHALDLLNRSDSIKKKIKKGS